VVYFFSVPLSLLFHNFVASPPPLLSLSLFMETTATEVAKLNDALFKANFLYLCLMTVIMDSNCAAAMRKAI
jgi:hypothetical protein